MRDIKFPKPPKEEASLKPFSPRGEMPRPVYAGAKPWLWILAALAAGSILFWAGTRFIPKEKPVRQEGLSAMQSLLQSIKEQGSAYGGLKDISLSAFDLLDFADKAQKKIPDFLAGRDIGLMELVSSAKDKLEAFSAAFEKLASNPENSNLPFFSDYLGWHADLLRGQAALEGIQAILSDNSSHHYILVLANTSELRPGGGFLGSFADAEIASGTLRTVTVKDINEVDRLRAEKIVPPLPLQAITGKWRTADANWFFDFPKSAEKILTFMGQSETYATTTLDGLVSITPKAVKDILEITGPVRLKDGREINSENFLQEIQKDVQAGQAEGSANPKAVLAELAPVLRMKLAELSAEQQNEFWSRARSWLAQKDVMVYMRQKKLAEVLASYGADGSLYPLTPDFEGDYVAIVNANIGGGKTDLYIDQKMNFESRIDANGRVHDKLTLVRTHRGDKAEEWWYRQTNWNYLQIYTPSGAGLEGAEGIGRRIITPKVNYKSGFSADPDVKFEESSRITSEDGKLDVFHESDRNVFGTWQKIEPGTSKSTVLSYARLLPSPPKDGGKYVFVLERQSGAPLSVDMLLAAPVGFVWKENGLPVYEYRSDDPPGRYLLTLTFAKK